MSPGVDPRDFDPGAGSPPPRSLVTPHEHRFTVPVEWERRDREAYGDPVFYAQRIRVTALRCEYCPEEINR